MIVQWSTHTALTENYNSQSSYPSIPCKLPPIIFLYLTQEIPHHIIWNLKQIRRLAHLWHIFIKLSHSAVKMNQSQITGGKQMTENKKRAAAIDNSNIHSDHRNPLTLIIQFFYFLYLFEFMCSINTTKQSNKQRQLLFFNLFIYFYLLVYNKYIYSIWKTWFAWFTLDALTGLHRQGADAGNLNSAWANLDIWGCLLLIISQKATT